MAIKIDPSPSETAVIQCDDCPHWSAVRFGCCEAHRCAVDHEKTFHADSETARWAARKHAQRHAAAEKATHP
ncbi:hypothetical protein [Microbacterium sp. NPDC087665]|uniref:hypothetical protein n=1 Tax=Microbacterium sp. NPDC087665 TaxID=3364194 RepID=UPI0038242F13